MGKFKTLQPDYNNPLHRWLMFLQDTIEEDRLEEIIMLDENIMSAQEELIKLSSDEDTRRLYELREKAIRDDLSRLSGAKAEGEKNKAIKIVKNAINKGLNDSDIQELTEMNIEEIQRIRKEVEGN